jgi:protein-disulfide isomerase
MKRLPILIAALVAASLSLPASANQAALKTWAERALPRCPGAAVALEKIDQQGPANFVVYRARQTSSDKNCGTQKYILHSPVTGQIVMGSIIPLPNDARPLQVRVNEEAGSLLKTQLSTTIAAFPLPDGLKDATMTRSTPHGPFAYRGFVDSSGRFLIVGLRSNLKDDPSKPLRDALKIETGARRGKKDARLEIVELSDFQCPTCARAHERLEPLFAKNLGKINYVRLDLPLFEHHEWAMPAAMAARAIQRIAPAKYWAFVDLVFKNQEQLSAATFDAFAKNFVEDNDISWAAVEKIYRSSAERTALLDQVSRAFAIGITSTPTFIINGQPIGFGDGTYAEETLKRAIGSATVTAAKKK